MKVVIDTSENIARLAAQQYKELLAAKPGAVLGLATGSTPLGLYGVLSNMCKAGEISFAKAHSFNLDEYIGLDGNHDQSYRYFMNENLFRNIDINISETHVPDGISSNQQNAADYDKLIEEAGGIDLQLLGIGVNGHIGFNEPGTPFGSLTHIVELTDSTRQANKRFFQSIDEVPTHAISMGIKSVMHARSVILMAIGENKAQCIKDTLEGPVTEQVPASVLQLHPDVTFYLDHDAAKLLTQ